VHRVEFAAGMAAGYHSAFKIKIEILNVAVCYSMLQCVAVCCRVVQCGAVWCSVVQCDAVCYIVEIESRVLLKNKEGKNLVRISHEF